MRPIRWAPALAAGAMALGLAACGGGSGTSTTSGTTAGGAATGGSTVAASAGQGGPEAAAAVKAATATAKLQGGPAKLPTKTLGLVNVTNESESAQRIQQGAVDAARAIGWKIKTVDAQGDPAKSQAGIASFVTQGVDGIISLSNATQAITQGLAQARAKDIPVINIGGLQDPSPNIESQFAVDETEMTAKLDKYMLAHIPKDAKIATHTFPLLLSERLRDEQLKKDLAGTDVKVVANHQTDFTALAADTQKSAKAQLTANPDLNAFWGDTDTQMPAIGQVLKAAGKCGKIGNYNFYDDKLNLAQIRSGCGTAVVTSPLGADGWAAVDALAQMWARNKPISSLPKGWPVVDKVYGVNIRNGDAIQVIDKSNLPPAGGYVKSKFDYTTFFKTLWHDEFGVGSGS